MAEGLSEGWGSEALKAEGIVGTKIQKLEASRNCGVLGIAGGDRKRGASAKRAGLAPKAWSESHRAGFLTLSATDIWGQIILCCGVCPVHRC